MPFRSSVWPVALAASMLAIGAPLRAQTLDELARQEEARRKEVKKPAKVYTNKDLKNVPPTSAEPQTEKPTTPGADTAKKDDGKDAQGKDAKDKDTQDKGVVKDQAYWSARMKELTTQLDRDQGYAEAMQTRVSALTTDFTARDDPAQRAVVARDRQRALDELDRLRKAIETDRQALADFQEEARRASVPPGWLR